MVSFYNPSDYNVIYLDNCKKQHSNNHKKSNYINSILIIFTCVAVCKNCVTAIEYSNLLGYISFVTYSLDIIWHVSKRHE